MLPYLNNQQLIQLKSVLKDLITSSNNVKEGSSKDNKVLLEKYFAAKRAEGCSEKSLKYYKATLTKAYQQLVKMLKKL